MAMSKNYSEYNAVDLGCGQRKHGGTLGVDIVDTNDADVIHDLESVPWPFNNNSFKTVYCKDILEHVSSPLQFLEEVYRITSGGGTVYIRTPHFTNANAWTDPTHKRPFTARTFTDYVTRDGQYSYYTDAAFNLVNMDIGFAPAHRYPWNILGRNIANRWPKLYEETVLRCVFPAKSMKVEMEVVKE